MGQRQRPTAETWHHREGSGNDWTGSLFFAVSFRLGYILSVLGCYDDRFHAPLAGPIEEVDFGTWFLWVDGGLPERSVRSCGADKRRRRLDVSSWKSAVSEESNILKRHAHLKEYKIYAKWRPKL